MFLWWFFSKCVYFWYLPEIQDGPQFFFWCQPDIQDGLHYFFGVDLKFKMTHSFFLCRPEIQDDPQFLLVFTWNSRWHSFIGVDLKLKMAHSFFLGVDLKFKIPQFFLCRPEFKMALNTGQCLTMVMGNEKLFL